MRRALREIALWTGAVAGVICLVAAVASLMFGIKPLIFRSGSMTPTISTGDLALAQPVAAHDLRVGDIISVNDAQGRRVTHRLVSINQDFGGAIAVSLRGDANPIDDVEPYVISNADRVFTHIPKAGYVVSWLGTPAARILGALMALGLAYLVFCPRRRRGTGSDTGADAGTGATAVGVATAVILTAAGGQFAYTRAAITDTATASLSATAAASFTPLPASMSCTSTTTLLTIPLGLLVDSAQLTWTPVTRPVGVTYQLVYKRGTTTVATVTTSDTSYYTIPSNVGSVEGNYTVELHSVRQGEVSTGFRAWTISYHNGVLGVLLAGTKCESQQAGSARVGSTESAATATGGTSSATSSVTPTSGVQSTAPGSTTAGSTTAGSSTTTGPTTTDPISTGPTTTAPTTTAPTTTAPTTTAPTTTTATTTSAAPVIAPVTDPSSTYTATITDGTLTITDAAHAVVYTRATPTATGLTWQAKPGDPTRLTVTRADGTSIVIAPGPNGWAIVS